jgi:hypothetical protein
VENIKINDEIHEAKPITGRCGGGGNRENRGQSEKCRRPEEPNTRSSHGKPLRNIEEKCRSGGVPQGTIPRPLRHFHGNASGVPNLIKIVRPSSLIATIGLIRCFLEATYDKNVEFASSSEKQLLWNCFTHCFAIVSKSFRKNGETISQE